MTVMVAVISGLMWSTVGLTAPAFVPRTTEPDTAPPPVWGELGADGEVTTVDVSRQAFADVFGSIGGIRPSGSPHPAAIDPSRVLLWIETVWTQLTR